MSNVCLISGLSGLFSVLRVVWFVRSILCFAHGLIGLVYPGCFLFCEWSGLSGSFSVLRMVWFIRAIFCIARGLVYPGHSLFCACSGLSWPFSARHVQCMSDICKRRATECGWGGEVVLSSDAVPPQPPPASPSNVADAAAASPALRALTSTAGH